MTLLPTVLVGQDAAVADDEVLWMSPFEVTSESVSGYTSTETLAGTRIKTDLRDLAQSISVVNSQFLQDTGATSSEDLLVYTSNTEVGGIYGNFSGVGGVSTYNENSKLLRPSENTRVRGLDAADNTRNYFLSEAPWDGYNVDRVEMQRGPNSILFGVGSPAGIVNVTSKAAFFDNERKVELRVDDQGSLRGSFDINQEIIEDELAVRLIALDEHTEYQQDPAYEKDKRIYGALRYEPKFFGAENPTSINVNFEHGSIDANRPRSLPPIDGLSPWFMTGESVTKNGVVYDNMNKMTLDPITTWNQYGNNSYYGDSKTYPWFIEANLGRMFNNNIGQFYVMENGVAVLDRTMSPKLGTNMGRDSDGNIDGTIGAAEFSKLWGIATYSSFARDNIPGGQFYSNVSLSDPTVYDFYNKLIDGPNKKEWQDWDTVNFSIAQTFMDNRFGFEVSGFFQEYEEGQYGFLNGDQFMISVDINEKLMDGSDNPNVGRAYVSNSSQYGNVMNFVDREDFRATAFADVRSTDFFEEGLLTRILGHSLISGLVSRDVRKNDQRQFNRWASTPTFTDVTGQTGDITSGLRAYDWITYLSDTDLRDTSITSPSGLNLSNVSTIIDPTGSVDLLYFDSTWIAGPDVAFDDPYTYYTHDSDGNLVPNEGTQADNLANYYGWRTSEFEVIGAEHGDIDQLYSSITKSRNTIKSQAITLQSYLFDESLVFTYGWRKDKVKNLSRQGPKGEYDVASPDFSVVENDGFTGVKMDEGQSRTWGLVFHAPEYVTKHLPWDMQLSAFYGRGENFKADAPRGDVFGNQLVNSRGETEDYGFVVSVLDNRVSLKTTWYETKVYDGTLAGDSAGFSSSLYYVWALPYWGATHALAALDGIHDPQLRQGSWGWPWNGIATMPNPDYDPTVDGSQATIPDTERIFEIVQDFFASFPLDQHFVDEYGLGMNVAAMHAAAANATYDNQASWQAFYDSIPTYGVDGKGAGDGLGLQPLYAGRLKSFGAAPVASCDTVSKGIEFELNARITDNWNVMLNVSKTESTRTDISDTIEEWIDTYTAFMAGDAGLINLWGGSPFRSSWANNVLTPFSTLKSQIGTPAPEISPWRANLVTNYNFSEGFLKGVNLGMAYRWEDERILGYAYDEVNNAIDVTKPWKGASEDHLDLWVGYGCPLTEKIDWRIQLNVKNVGESDHLVPVNMQPDGSVALSRIAYGTSWFVTTTFTF